MTQKFLPKQTLKNRIYSLEHIVRQIWWLARRYADGRMSYAVETYNEAMREMQRLGIHVLPDPIGETIWAKDGMENCNRLTPEQQMPGSIEATGGYIHIDKLKELCLEFDKLKCQSNPDYMWEGEEVFNFIAETLESKEGDSSKS